MYSPPAGNAANFNFTGAYSAPAGNAADFAFSISLPGAATARSALRGQLVGTAQLLGRAAANSTAGLTNSPQAALSARAGAASQIGATTSRSAAISAEATATSRITATAATFGFLLLLGEITSNSSARISTDQLNAVLLRGRATARSSATTAGAIASLSTRAVSTSSCLFGNERFTTGRITATSSASLRRAFATAALSGTVTSQAKLKGRGVSSLPLRGRAKTNSAARVDFNNFARLRGRASGSSSLRVPYLDTTVNGVRVAREFDGEDPLWVGFEVDVFDRQYPENANGTTTLRMSNRGNLTRVVGGMVRSYLPRLRTPIVIGTTLTIFSGSGTTSSDAVSMFQQPLRGRDNGGRVEWALGPDVTDPFLSNWMDPRRFRWLGTTFRLYEGRTFDPDNADVDRDLQLVYTGHVADITFDLSATAPTAGIDTTDASSDLDRSLVDDLYATDYPIVALRGLPKPELHGRALSIAPVLEDQANLIYRVSHNALDDVTELRVGGVPWQRVFTVGPGPVVSYQITQVGGPGYLAFYMDPADIGWWVRNGATVTIGGALPALKPGEALYTVVQPLGPSYIAALNAINYDWWIAAGATVTPFTGTLPPPPPTMGVSPNLTQPIGTPSQGQWYADLVGGTVQLGSITGGAEVRVDAQAVGWATLDTAQLITDICTSKGVPVDPAYMAQLRIDWPGITSYYTTTTPVDALDALDTITLGNLCWWAFGPDGAVIAGFVKGPEQDPMSDFLLLGSSPAVPLDSTLLPTIPPLDPVPKELTTYTQQQILPPAWRVRVEYLRRWAPESTFLGGLTENEASALRAPGQVWDWTYSPLGFTLTPADGLTIRLTEPRAQDIYVKSLALSDNDAQALRLQVVQNITGIVERNVLDVTAWVDSWQLRLFQNITLLWVDVSTDTQAIYGGTFRLTSAIRSLGGGPQQMELWGSATVISTTDLAPIPRSTAPLRISVVVQQLSPTATTGAVVAFATLTDSAGNPFATGVTFTAPFGNAGGLLAINQIGPAYFAITLTGPLPTPGPFNGSIGAVDAGISVSVNFAFAANSVPSFPQTPPPPPTLTVVMTPPSPIVLPNTPLGAIVATLQGVWSNGAPFTGTFQFAAPNFNQGGIYEISGNWLIISPSGPGVSQILPTTPIVTIVGIQN